MIQQFYRTIRYILSHPLGRRHRLGVLSRFIRWQLGSRLLPYPIAVPFVGPTFLVQERGMAGSTGNFYVGLHEFYDMTLVLHFLRPGDLFLDIGANVGSYSLLAGGVAGAQCCAFEPVPQTYSRLTRNIAFNRLGEKIKSRCVALGSDEGTVHFTADRDAMNQVVTADYQGKTIDVPVTRLDALQPEFDGPFEAMMWKVDVEGFETHVLQGAAAMLSDPRLKIVLLEAGNDELTNTMKNHGFTATHYSPHSRTFDQSEKNGQNNNLWVRDLEFIAARVASAPKFDVLNEKI